MFVSGLSRIMPQKSSGPGRLHHHAFDILGSYRRRLVLATVSGADTPISLSRLATRVVASEADKPTTAVTSDERTRTETHLHHADLPPLVAADLLSYDAERQTVESSDLPLEGDEWLEMPVVEALESWNRRR